MRGCLEKGNTLLGSVSGKKEENEAYREPRKELVQWVPGRAPDPSNRQKFQTLPRSQLSGETQRTGWGSLYEIHAGARVGWGGCWSPSTQLPSICWRVTGSDCSFEGTWVSSWQTLDLSLFPCLFLADVGSRGLFYISVEQIKYTFWVFSHRSAHEKMPESSGECRSSLRPSGKTLIWTAAGGATEGFPLKPLHWRRTLAQMVA